MMVDRIQNEREARAYVARGEYEKAISLYREILDSKGKDPNIYNLIGDVYVRMDDFADAMPEYLTAIDLYEQEGLFENGIAVCKKIMRLNPDAQEVHFNLALFYAEIGLLNEAKDSLLTYLKRFPDKRKIEKNIQKYKKIMMRLASDERLKPTIKELYTKINKRENELDAIFGLAPPKPPTKMPEPQKSPETEPAGATKEPAQPPHEKPSQEPPAQPEVNEKEVQLLLHAVDEVMSYEGQKIKRNHYKLGTEYKNLRLYDAAIREFQRAITSNSNPLKALEEIGYCFLEKAEPKLAIKAFKKGIEEGGKTAENYLAMRYGMGRAYELLEDKENAISSFEEVCFQNIDYADAQKRLTQLKES